MIRLYNVVTDIEEDGFVQICKNGYWYTVSGYSWDCNDGDVACRQLGYDQASESVMKTCVHVCYFISHPQIHVVAAL